MRALHKSVKALLCKLELSLQAVSVLTIRPKRRLCISAWHSEPEISNCKAHIYGKRPAILFSTGIGWERKLAFLVPDDRVFVGFDPAELEGMVPSLF